MSCILIASPESKVNTYMPYMLLLFHPIHPAGINQSHCPRTWLACNSVLAMLQATNSSWSELAQGRRHVCCPASTVQGSFSNWQQRIPTCQLSAHALLLESLPFISFTSRVRWLTFEGDSQWQRFSSGCVLLCSWIRHMYRTFNTQSCVDRIRGWLNQNPWKWGSDMCFLQHVQKSH